MVAIASIRQRSVTVYSTSWCPQSRRAKALLDRLGVVYTDTNIEVDAVAAKQVEAYTGGYRSVPTIIFNLVITEPSTSDLEMILVRSGAHIVSLAVYVTDWCPHSRRVEAWLREQRIAASRVDIEADQQAAARVQAWNKGFLSTATLDAVLRLTEPTSDQIEAILGLRGT